MATSALRSLWAEPRPTNAPDRGPRDWALVAVLICWSVVEVVLRQDLAPRPLLLLAMLAVLGPGGALDTCGTSVRRMAGATLESRCTP